MWFKRKKEKNWSEQGLFLLYTETSHEGASLLSQEAEGYFSHPYLGADFQYYKSFFDKNKGWVLRDVPCTELNRLKKELPTVFEALNRLLK